MAHLLIKLLREETIAVENQNTIATVRWHRVTPLLKGPCCCGVRSPNHLSILFTPVRILADRVEFG